MNTLAREAPISPEAPQREAMGMWVFIASEMLFFGALGVTYAYGRVLWPEGFAAASRHTDVVLGTLNTALLLTSSLCVALAAEAPRRIAARLLAATALLGVVFLAIKGIEYRHEWQEGLFPGPAFQLGEGEAVPQGAQLFFAFYFVATGLHALHVSGGIGWMGVLAWGRSKGRAWANDDVVHVAGLYWHFVDVVWILLYPALYLVSRHS
ncbi:cytochrome c oxidase subunit 3 [Variovorax sp. dw_308]|uniref:cytochrome c oxidase subunit 3 n=1 Tax=Variovorax sp. dw_308 TaxID=2721546 RepID=UPI001C46288E